MPAEIRPLGVAELRSVAEISPAQSNPRKIPQRAVEVVAESLKRFGWQQPLVVDKAGELIVGHTRFKAAQLLELTEVPVVVAEHLTEDEIEAYRIADNRTHDFTSWDYPVLVEQLEDLSADFSDVLALDDWQSLVGDLADIPPDVPDDVKNNAGVQGFTVAVVFATKEQAIAAEQQLIDLPGVLDVRHPRS